MSPSSFLTSILSFILCLMFTSNLHSQSPSYLDSLNGKFALQFQIESLFRLSSFQGSTFSGKYNFTDRDVVRLGITIGITDANRDNDINEIDSTRSYYLNGNENHLELRLNVQYMRYITVENEISFFGGGGPFVRIFSSSENYKVIRYGKEEDWIRDKDGYSLGLEFIVGVEWMFYDDMTLSGEYGISMDYTKSDIKEVEDEIIQKGTDKSYNVDYNRVKFGLSVYF